MTVFILDLLTLDHVMV